MAITKQQFPPAVLAMQKELVLHPELSKQCISDPDQSLEGALAHIATYCGIIVDGTYDLEDLCRMLTMQLQKKRTVAVYAMPERKIELATDAEIVGIRPYNIDTTKH